MNPKFRAWDKEKEKMLEVANISFDKEAYGYDLITIDKAKESPMLWTFNRLEDFALMQSTGLKDKNGVEIYEGDIVKYVQKDIVKVGTVEYDNMLCSFLLDDTALLLSAGVGVSYFKGEVIGSIYENPELLEVAE